MHAAAKESRLRMFCLSDGEIFKIKEILKKEIDSSGSDLKPFLFQLEKELRK